MIDETNSIKITDFGIAKVLNAAATKSATMIVGTPLYMAPEQIDGRNVDQRADIYSLGIMLYEMITGNPPFYEGSDSSARPGDEDGRHRASLASARRRGKGGGALALDRPSAKACAHSHGRDTPWPHAPFRRI
jgi:serine/threonine protein kinase